MKPGDWVRHDDRDGQVLYVGECWGTSGKLPTRLLVLWRGDPRPSEVLEADVEFRREGTDVIEVVGLRRSDLVRLVNAAFVAEDEAQGDAGCARPLVEALGLKWDGRYPW